MLCVWWCVVEAALVCVWQATDKHKLCWQCRTKVPPGHKVLDPLTQIGQNASQLMAALPVHSYHRAPLISALSQHIPSTTAATLLRAAASTIRNAKRKDHSSSDLMQQSYSHGVKRQKIAAQRISDLCDFIAAACPTKSGERSVTHHQFTTDDSLYSAYRRSTSTPVSFSCFYKIKRWMRVRCAGRYLGQFDCSKCIMSNKMQHKTEAELSGEEAQSMRGCQLHQQTKNCSVSTTSRCGPLSSRVSCWC